MPGARQRNTRRRAAAGGAATAALAAIGLVLSTGEARPAAQIGVGCPSSLVSPWSLRQIGSSAPEVVDGVEVDAARCAIYLVGDTTGTVGATPSAGSADIVVARYDTLGVQRWLLQTGSSGADWVTGSTIDADGNVYVSGYTSGTLPGSPIINLGGQDAFVLKIDPDGVVQWTRQLGGVDNDYGTAVAATSTGDVYLAGDTFGTLIGLSAGGRDFFLGRYDSAGNLVMLLQRGSAGDERAWGVAVGPSDNAYVVGDTTGDLEGINAGSSDLFVGKYDDAGAELWIDQRGTSGLDIASAVAVTATNDVYLTGWTAGGLDGHVSAGFDDIILLRYDANGNWRFTKQRGSAASDNARGLALTGGGAPIVVGGTAGALDGNVNAGGADAFLMKFGRGGAWIWTRQIGGNSADGGLAIAVMGQDDTFATGYFYNTFTPLTSLGSSDVFAVRYDASGNQR